MQPLASYVLDRESIKLHCYQLICLFYANKEIARQSDPTHEYPDPAAQLERAFFARELTRLLLSIAIAVRTLDDQMNARRTDDPDRIRYVGNRDLINKRHHCMMFDELSLRETCNKLIHASTVEPHTTDGVEPHKYDEYMWEGWQQAREEDPEGEYEEPKAMPWEHLSGLVRLGGRHGKQEWWLLLEVPVFIEAIYGLLEGEA